MLNRTGNLVRDVPEPRAPRKTDDRQHTPGRGELNEPVQAGGEIGKVVQRRHRRDDVIRPGLERVVEDVPDDPLDTRVLRPGTGDDVPVAVALAVEIDLDHGGPRAARWALVGRPRHLGLVDRARQVGVGDPGGSLLLGQRRDAQAVPPERGDDGAGERAESCQACHMPSRDAEGRPLRSKIASIQEFTNFPQAEMNLGPEEIDLPVRAGWVWADPRVDAVRGQVAVQRGPLVMCLESVDLEEDVNFASVSTDTAPVERDGQVLVRVTTARPAELPWPFPGERPAPSETRDAGLVPLVPYHRWGNRGPATMRVWIPEA